MNTFISSRARCRARAAVRARAEHQVAADGPVKVHPERVVPPSCSSKPFDVGQKRQPVLGLEIHARIATSRRSRRAPCRPRRAPHQLLDGVADQRRVVHQALKLLRRMLAQVGRDRRTAWPPPRCPGRPGTGARPCPGFFVSPFNPRPVDLAVRSQGFAQVITGRALALGRSGP